jgi:hypothetical protein
MFNIIYLFDIFYLNSLCDDLIFIFVKLVGFYYVNILHEK